MCAVPCTSMVCSTTTYSDMPREILHQLHNVHTSFHVHGELFCFWWSTLKKWLQRLVGLKQHLLFLCTWHFLKDRVLCYVRCPRGWSPLARGRSEPAGTEASGASHWGDDGDFGISRLTRSPPATAQNSFSVIVAHTKVLLAWHIKGFQPEWCISTIYHCRDTPF